MATVKVKVKGTIRCQVGEFVKNRTGGITNIYTVDFREGETVAVLSLVNGTHYEISVKGIKYYPDAIHFNNLVEWL